MNLNNISALVTGGASGLGEATARALAAEGAHVVIADLQEDKGHAVASSIGGRFVRTDVTQEADAAAALATRGAASAREVRRPVPPWRGGPWRPSSFSASFPAW